MNERNGDTLRALWTDLIISIPWDKLKNLYSQERVVLLLVRGSFFTENIGVNISTSQGVQDIGDCGSSSCFWRDSFLLRFLHKENCLILVFTEFTRPLHVNLKFQSFVRIFTSHLIPGMIIQISEIKFEKYT